MPSSACSRFDSRCLDELPEFVHFGLEIGMELLRRARDDFSSHFGMLLLNVRELQNIIQRAAVISTGRVLHLPEEWQERPGPKSLDRVFTTSVKDVVPKAEKTFQPTKVDDLYRQHITRVLEQTNWRIEGPKGAALILGLHPSTARARMLKLGIRRESGTRTRQASNTKEQKQDE